MGEMTSRERVLKVLNHETPDRVPVSLMSSGSAMTNEMQELLKQKLGIEGTNPHWRMGYGDSIYDDRILDALGTDIRHVYPQMNLNFIEENKNKIEFIEPFNVPVRLSNNFYERINPPLANATIKDLENFNWPKPEEVLDIEIIKKRAKYLKENTDKAISLRAPIRGLFIQATQMRGYETVLMDFLINKKFIQRLIEKIMEVKISFYSYMLEEIGEYVDIVETEDDYGSQSGLLFSPKVFKESIKEYRTHLNKVIKEKAPHVKIYFHCCGSIRGIIPDLIDCGIDILNPIQPLAVGMETDLLAKDFGKDLVFFGAIDLQKALPGSIDDVEAEVKRRIRDLGSNSSYILAPGNTIQKDIPVENVIALYEFARKYGKYPIHV